MLTKQHVCIYIACATPMPGESGTPLERIKRYPLPADTQLTELLEVPLYCFNCGTRYGIGRSASRVTRCASCIDVTHTEFDNAWTLARLVLSYDFITENTLFNLFLHWCRTKPDKYQELRKKIKNKSPQQAKTRSQTLLEEMFG